MTFGQLLRDIERDYGRINFRERLMLRRAYNVIPEPEEENFLWIIPFLPITQSRYIPSPHPWSTVSWSREHRASFTFLFPSPKTSKAFCLPPSDFHSSLHLWPRLGGME